MSCECGCCAGISARTPRDVANPPGLASLSRRVGTHGDFLESMLAALASPRYPALAGLRTREPSDPAIALLDAGATLLDVLSFYQERIANEGYLRTATERRSILELARLVGFRLRPGVAASAWLAYTLEQGHRVTIPKRSKVQSAPGPGELPQTFETSADLDARAEWNKLTPRPTRPQTRASILDRGRPPNERRPRVYLTGTTTRLAIGDRLLIDFGTDQPMPFRVTAVKPDLDRDRTAVFVEPLKTDLVKSVQTLLNGLQDDALKVALQAPGNEAVAVLADVATAVAKSSTDSQVLKALKPAVRKLGKISEKFPNEPGIAFVDAIIVVLSSLVSTAEARAADALVAGGKPGPTPTTSVLGGLTKPSSIPPRRLARTLGARTAANDLALGVIGALRPSIRDLLPIALENEAPPLPQPIAVYALRTKAAPFGHNAPREAKFVDVAVAGPTMAGVLESQAVWPEWTLADDEAIAIGPEPQGEHCYVFSGVFLELDQPAIVEGSYALVTSTYAAQPTVVTVTSTQSLTRNAYGLSGKSTQLVFDRAWRVASDQLTEAHATHAVITQPNLDVLRKTVVYAQSEKLELVEEPIEDDLCGGRDEPWELGGLFAELPTGRRLIVAGERTDILDTSGVPAAELVVVSEVEHTTVKDLPGDQTHTFIRVAEPLAYCYKRDTVAIYGNVVDATHGEARAETLGGGDGAKPFQEFSLKAKPLTFTAAATAAGSASSLDVRVNDVRWHERDTLADQPADARVFVTRIDDTAETTVTFGDGIDGARLPTGLENVKAVYRSGIGKAGNVKAGQLTTLSSKPLGVKEVVNPLAASGGADADTRDQARRLVPVSVEALDRLVSVSDYADFSRAFAGISKAAARRLSAGARQLVHVTVAGVDDAPILESSDLFASLSQALGDLGDPFQPVELAVRGLVLLVVSARVQLDSDHVWELTEPKIRAALLDAFDFERRDLAQPARSSELLAVIQSVDGVNFVDLEAFGGIREWRIKGNVRDLITPEDIAADIADIAKNAAQIGADCPWPSRFCPVRAAEAQWSDVLGEVLPAELAILSPTVPDTLILNPI